MKCRKCGESISNFSISGLCQNCCRFIVHSELHGKNYRKGRQVQEYIRKQNIKSKYGLTWNDYLLMIESQDGKCKICGREIDIVGRNTHVDHCHATGRIRGVLCGRCNTALGMIYDDINIALSIVDYLNKAELS